MCVILCVVTKEIGARIRSAREALGLTRQQLAERVGASPTSVANWETGATEPRLVTGAIERELGIQLRGTADPPAGPPLSEASVPLILAELSRRFAEQQDRLHDQPAQTGRRRAPVTDLRPPVGENLPEGWAARERGRARPDPEAQS